MWAVLSDIHGNLEALDAVLADIAKHAVSQVFCIGDLVGYGPNPIECIEKAMAWDLVLLGNHDNAAMFGPDGFCESAERAIFWTQSVLEQNLRIDLWQFIAQRPRFHTQGDFLFVHGSPRNPTNEYVFPEDIYNERKMTSIGEKMARYCFCGHTHIPGMFVEAARGKWEFRAPTELPGFYRLDGRKTIVNVGSVGQPRDDNWRACYALVEGWDITFRRVEYDVDATVAKIYAIPELADFLGDRLRKGR
jgi:diadenosine tetraphosphatase ApaH/serine/threonine PP2A family protein phosphatase